MYSIAIFLAFVFFSCAENKKSQDDSFSYDLNRPDKVYMMPKPLKEISGISVIDGNKLACIEDNHGIIYIYDLTKEKIIREISFAEKGDFEDVSRYGNGYFVLRSDGTIFQINGEKTIVSKTTLSEVNNTEGLCYDKTDNSLLIACKDQAGNGLPASSKSVYKFNLKDQTMTARPFITISTGDIILPDSEKNYEADGEHFSPSGIAIHPVSGNIFIISSRGNILVETDRSGKILHAEKIYNKLFPQPEGICFTPEGDLLISNEGKEHQHGTILRFKQK